MKKLFLIYPVIVLGKLFCCLQQPVKRKNLQQCLILSTTSVSKHHCFQRFHKWWFNKTSDGGATISALAGVCWGATANPTISESKTSENVGYWSICKQYLLDLWVGVQLII